MNVLESITEQNKLNSQKRNINKNKNKKTDNKKKTNEFCRNKAREMYVSDAENGCRSRIDCLCREPMIANRGAKDHNEKK